MTSAPWDKGGYYPLDTFAFEALAVTTAVGFTSATMDPVESSGTARGQRAIMAHVQCQVAAVRYRIDGTNPTAAIGAILNPGDELVVWGTMDLDSIRFIAVGGAATLAIHYSR
jgi:hypothetical protein